VMRFNSHMTRNRPVEKQQALSSHDKDMLDRVRVIETISESREVVGRLLSDGLPVAVDMEGVEADPGQVTGLIQVKDLHGNFSFFRTGLNPGLYGQGRLAELLENPTILKIMHGSSVDCLSVYRDGVRMWGLYDTAVAHKVLQFQLEGSSMYSGETIGLNNLCSYCSVQTNPFKAQVRSNYAEVKKLQNGIMSKVMSDELKLYCAWDVEQLHDIHTIISSRIAPDYSPLVQQLTEVEVIRAIDPVLAKTKRNSVNTMEVCAVSLLALAPGVTKASVYQLVANIPGNKHVYFSDQDHTANLILESREAALRAVDKISQDLAGGFLGEHAQCKLVCKDYAEKETIEKVAPVPSQPPPPPSPPQRTDQMVQVDLATSRALFDCVERSAVPVVLDFQQTKAEDSVGGAQQGAHIDVNIYVGRFPRALPLTREFLDAGLAQLLGNPGVTKVVFSLGTQGALAALRLLADSGVKVENIFELDTASKCIDFAECGQSIFTSATKRIKDLMDKFHITRETEERQGTLEWYYLVYLHLVHVLPPALEEVMVEKIKMEVGMAGYENLLYFKSGRADLRKTIDNYSVHLRLVGNFKKLKRDAKKEAQSELKKMVFQKLALKNIQIKDYFELGRCGLVLLDTRYKTLKALDILQSFENINPNLRFVASRPKKEIVIEMPIPTPADMKVLEERRKVNLKQLNTAGFEEISWVTRI